MSDAPVSPVVGSVYLHVGNSGLNVAVLNERGPTLLLETHSFGNLNSTLKVFTTVNGLRELRDLLDRALSTEFSKPYCCAAEAESDRGPCGSGCCSGACGD